MAYLSEERFLEFIDELPYSDNRLIGAGYAMASAAVFSAVLYPLFSAIMMIAIGLGIGATSPGGLPVLYMITVPLAMIFYASAAIPAVAPLGFISGVIAWRVDFPVGRYSGAVNGLTAAITGYLSLTVAIILLSTASSILAGLPVNDAITSSLMISSVVFIATFWITIPSGTVMGRIYEKKYRGNSKV